MCRQPSAAEVGMRRASGCSPPAFARLQACAPDRPTSVSPARTRRTTTSSFSAIRAPPAGSSRTCSWKGQRVTCAVDAAAVAAYREAMKAYDDRLEGLAKQRGALHAKSWKRRERQGRQRPSWGRYGAFQSMSTDDALLRRFGVRGRPARADEQTRLEHAQADAFSRKNRPRMVLAMGGPTRSRFGRPGAGP